MCKTEEIILGQLKKQKLSLGIVESATGGLISHRLTNVPGISECYKGGVTAYANETKNGVLGVGEDTIVRYGAVSREGAEEMAAGGRRVLGVDVCLSDTGIAGPGGATPSKQVGLFYMGLAQGDRVVSRKYIFEGNREEIKAAAAEAGLAWVKEYLTGLSE